MKKLFLFLLILGAGPACRADVSLPPVNMTNSIVHSNQTTVNIGVPVNIQNHSSFDLQFTGAGSAIGATNTGRLLSFPMQFSSDGTNYEVTPSQFFYVTVTGTNAICQRSNFICNNALFVKFGPYVTNACDSADVTNALMILSVKSVR